MIDVKSETLITLAVAASLVPGRSGKGVAMATIWRWVLRGVRNVQLESILIGGTRYTSREAIERFVANTNRVTRTEGQQIGPTDNARLKLAKQELRLLLHGRN